MVINYEPRVPGWLASYARVSRFVCRGMEPSMGAVDPVDDGRYPDFDVSKPNVARVYDAMLGGKNNFAADRGFVGRLLRFRPQAPAGPPPTPRSSGGWCSAWSLRRALRSSSASDPGCPPRAT